MAFATWRCGSPRSTLALRKAVEANDAITPVPRRLILDAIAAAVASSSTLAGAAVAAAGGFLVVLGASGGTGKQCVKYAAAQGLKVRACTRSGELPEDLRGIAGVEAGKCSVTSSAELKETLLGAAGVIFAASASRSVKSDDPKAVDYEGLINTGKVCLEAGVPRLVVVSSGGVSKPSSAVYNFLNLFGSIMEYKIRGEDAIRQMYAADTSAASYTIIRPGGLTQEEPKGVGSLELNQGDEKSGRISRTDVAALCIESIGDASAADTTFECYTRGTGQPLGNVGFNNIFKGGASDFATGRERVGASWPELFRGLEKGKA